jgi:hypothetical protein
MAFLEYSPTNSLFHYSSVAGVEGILRSGTLWFSDLKKSNDPKEFNMPKNMVLEAIKNIDRLEIEPEKRNFTILITYELLRAVEGQRIFTFCLTTNRDSRTEWKEYGDNGCGLSLSIRPRALRDMYIRVQKVAYINEHNKDFIINKVEEQYEKIRFFSDKGPDDEQYLEIVTGLISLIYSVKHFSWKDENEVRLTFAASEKTDLPIAVYPDESLVKWRPPKQRINQHDSIDYYDIPYGRYCNNSYDKSGAIEEIIIGPNCNLNEQNIHEMVENYGFKNVKVSRSSCAFR